MGFYSQREELAAYRNFYIAWQQYDRAWRHFRATGIVSSKRRGFAAELKMMKAAEEIERSRQTG